MVRLDALLLLLAIGVGIARVSSSAPQPGSDAVPVAVPNGTVPIAPALQATHAEMPKTGPALPESQVCRHAVSFAA